MQGDYYGMHYNEIDLLAIQACKEIKEELSRNKEQGISSSKLAYLDQKSPRGGNWKNIL